MSHQPERKERNCLNCSAEVMGRFCHICGQENIVTRQSFWSLIQHFVFDILHFDGKFFHTIGYIFSKPGFVARQYAEGKRVRYLDPIRMYLFTSALFFLVFFSVSKLTINPDAYSIKLTPKERLKLAREYEDELANNPLDTSLRQRIRLLNDTLQPIDIDSLGWGDQQVFTTIRNYETVAQYDSLQQQATPSQRDTWFERFVIRKGIQSNKKYKSSGEMVKGFIDSFVHRLPYLLFVSLPFFALLLKLLYVRRKDFYYSDHAVFTLYHYIFSFILLLLVFSFSGLQTWTGWDIWSFFSALAMMAWPVYLYIQMKNFYRQSKGKTFAKFLLLNVAGFCVLILLFGLFLVFSIFQL